MDINISSGSRRSESINAGAPQKAAFRTDWANLALMYAERALTVYALYRVATSEHFKEVFDRGSRF